MVQQTRRVVEDYVLYKIHSTLSVQNYIPGGGAQFSSNQDNSILMNHLPLPPQTPSRLSLSLRNIARKYEIKYRETFPDLLEEIRTSDVSVDDIDHIFTRVSKELFQLPLKQTSYSNRAGAENGSLAAPSNNNYASVQSVTLDDSHIKWGHLVALLVFAGILAVRAVECRSPEAVDCIVTWVTRFFDTELAQWLAKHGGWENIIEWTEGSGSRLDYQREAEFDPNSFTAGIRSVMSVGVLAACVGLGAFMMSKK